MSKIDDYEPKTPGSFEKSKLTPGITKSELADFKAAARATAIKERRGNSRLSSRLISAAVLMSLFAFTSMAEAKKKVSAPPAGSKVASGHQFDIYVVLKESKPFAATSSVLNIYQTTVVVHQTRKHGRQRFGGRLEAIDADLLDPSMWQVGDFDGDGLDDYRAVAGISKNGCRTWATQTWLRDRERFTFGAKITYLTDAHGKEVKSCR